jgi:hypothetical protein
MTEIRNSVLAGIAFGILFGIFLAIRFDPFYALIVGPICGLAFGLAMYFFVTSKTVKKQTQIQTADGEVIIHSGSANHFSNREAVGGKLYLLNDKLQFQSHGFNLQNHGLVIKLNQIQKIDFYNGLGLMPNGLVILTTEGGTEKFVVNNRRLWKSKIETAKQKSVNNL